MSRFSGWTAAAVAKVNGYIPDTTNKKPKGSINGGSKYVEQICAALDILGIQHKREYKFLHDRRFRFDIALPQHKIAIEFEGGVYSKGRHTRSTGYINDVKKYNLAVMHGWRLLRYTTADTTKVNWEFRVAQEIQDLIKNPKLI